MASGSDFCRRAELERGVRGPRYGLILPHRVGTTSHNFRSKPLTVLPIPSPRTHQIDTLCRKPPLWHVP